MNNMLRFVLLLVFSLGVYASSSVDLTVDYAHPESPAAPIWTYFGYDEPNYTYTENGRKLIHELADLSRTPVHIRTHNLFTTGNGIAALKWGSTNAYTEDASGHPVYNWTITDKIIDTFREAGAKPLIEIGFTPKALSPHPEPYQHDFPHGNIFTGWAYPPKDYEKWSELVRHFAQHCAERYGKAEAVSWDWEVWNEPDIGYWHGTASEYNTLYDHTVRAIKQVLPEARVGGPATTGPASPKAAEFLRQFLDHCAKGSVPLDFISFHVKGHPDVVNGSVVMGLSHELRDAQAGFQIVRASPFPDLPILLTEADPEGCAACSAQNHPSNAYRNGTLYPAYTAVAWKALGQLAKQQQVHLQAMLTWAFEFEAQPLFAGFRDLATDGVDKPILNFFRMAGLMEGEPLPVRSSGALSLETLTNSDVRNTQDVDGLAMRSDHRATVLVWNYAAEDVANQSATVNLHVSGLPSEAERVLVAQYRIDADHSNAYTAWKQTGAPQTLSESERKRLERSGQLQLFTSPKWITRGQAPLDLKLETPPQSLSLIAMHW